MRLTRTASFAIRAITLLCTWLGGGASLRAQVAPSGFEFAKPVLVSPTPQATVQIRIPQQRPGGTIALFDGITPLGVRQASGELTSVTVKLAGTGVRYLRAVYRGAGGDVVGRAAMVVRVRPVTAGALAAASDFAISGNWKTVHVTDLNGDGVPDVIAGNGTGELRTFAGTGTGVRALAVASLAGPVTSFVTADFDEDGRTDLVAVLANSVVLLRGNGEGSFQPPVTVYTGASNSAVVADFDGDGRVDLAVAGTTSTVNILRGRGNGTFDPPRSVDAGTPIVAQGLAVADFNTDGNADLAAAGAAGVTVFAGGGNGSFSPPAGYTAGLNNQSLAVGDVTGDGSPDILLGGNALAVLASLPGGTLAAPVTVDAGGTISGLRVLAGAALAGTVAAIRGGVLVHFRNEGGTLAGGEVVAVAGQVAAIASADMNGDLRPDVFTAGSSLGLVSGTPDANNFVVISRAADASAVNLVNGGFELPALTYGQFQYHPAWNSGIGWFFSTTAGVSGNGSGFTGANSAAPEGTQVGLVQMNGFMSQDVSGFNPGSTYSMRFTVAKRAGYGDQTIQILMYDYDGYSEDPPIDLGTYSLTDPNWQTFTTPEFSLNYPVGYLVIQGSSSTDATAFLDNISINHPVANVTLGNLSQTYTGTPRPVTVATDPAGLAVTVTYNGSATAPTNKGSYAVVATVTDPNYSGRATGTLVIAPQPVTITISNLSQVYDGTPKSPSVSTSRGQYQVVFDFANGDQSQRPTTAGSWHFSVYYIIATAADQNYEPAGTWEGTLIITKAAGTVTLGTLTANADGSPKAATATTNPAGMTVNFTYNGSATAPSAAGSYTVVGTISNPNYSGSATGTLIIRGQPSITLGSLAPTYDGQPHAATAATVPANLPVTFTYNGSSVVPIAAGSYTVVASVDATSWFGSTTGTLVIARAVATVNVVSATNIYNGSARTLSATVIPFNAGPVTMTYNGSPTAVNAGTYTVVATVDNPNYTGSGTGTLTISKRTVSVTLGGLSAPYTGSPQYVTATSSLPVTGFTYTYNGSSVAPSAVGSYAVVATVSDPNHDGSASGTFSITKGTASISFPVNPPPTYNGTAQSIPVSTSPGGLTVRLTYNGLNTPPVNAGTYAVIATIDDANWSGTASTSFVIQQARVSIIWTTTTVTYDGAPKVPTFTTSPAGIPISLTYSGNPVPPTAVGTYGMVATSDNPNYVTDSGNFRTFVINKAPVTMTFGNLAQVYSGTPRVATVVTNPAGIAVSLVYSFEGNSMLNATNAGSYTVVGTVTDPNYVGTAQATLVVSPAPATLTLTNLNQTYPSARAPAVVTVPADLSYTLTYDGSSSLPSLPGAYNVVATLRSNQNYQGSTTGTFVISKGTAGIFLVGLEATYTGAPKSVTASTSPGSIPVDLTYDGSPNAPTEAGSYTVVGTVNSTLWQGSSTGTLVIAKAPVTVTISSTVISYDGTPKAPFVSAGGARTFTLTYNGSSTTPTAAGDYSVVAAVTDPNYTGTGTAIFTIQKATLRFTLGNLNATYDGSPKPVSVTTIPAGIPVNVRYSGSLAVPSAVGTYGLLVESADPNYVGGSGGFDRLEIQPGTATLTLSNLSAVYDGAAHVPTVVTNPVGLPVVLQWGTSGTALNAGSYDFNARVSDPNYSGNVSGILVVSPAPVTITLSGLNAIFDSSPHPVIATTNVAGVSTRVTYDGSNRAPTAAGVYGVVATVDSNPNYTGTASGTLTIGKGVASVTLTGLNSSYNGTPRTATASTVPAALGVSITYNGGTVGPVLPGSYAVVANVNDANYTGTATGTLVVDSGVAISLNNLTQSYDGTPRVVTGTTALGLPVTVLYNGSATAPVGVGSYAITATASNGVIGGITSATLVVTKGTATVSLGNLSATFDGGPKGASAVTVPAGLPVSITYNGNPVAPTLAGSYAVAATVNDANYQGTASGTLVIGKATAAVTLTNLNAVYNATGKTAGAITSPAGLQVTFTYNGGTSLPVTAGSYAVVATVADNNYTGTGIGTMVIAKATPMISWGTPAPMTFGGALSNLQLNAAASVGGTFVYSPAAGTVLPIGAGQLGVTFTPADSLNYNVAVGGVSLSVVPGPVVNGANLIVTRTMSRDAFNNILVKVTIANAGNTAAANVVVTNLAIGTAKATLLPQSFGTIESGGIVSRVLTIPGPVGAAGSSGMLSVSGTFTNGTLLANARITLP